ncbi:MAG TPA: TlpA disulfide reductase family protein [Acidobacteriota bacterium]|nr:TlpA disulfide reductase family protein [Acidobacteriota bacterium]
MNAMSRFATICAAAAAAVFVFAACGAGKSGAVAVAPKVAQGQTLGDATYVGLDGAAVQFKSLVAGKVALVDVWASWCGPCREAIPHLKDLQAKYGSQGFTVVGVMTDKNASRIGAAFAKEQGFNYPVVLDDDAAKTEGLIGPVDAIPYLLVVDKSGKVLKTFEGLGDPKEIEDAVAAALKG